jgi:hypothetical protein
MRGHPYDQKVRSAVLYLRMKERLSLDEIQARSGVAKGTLSVWLRKHPLSNKERVGRRVTAAQVKRDQEPRSKFFSCVPVNGLSRSRKAKIAEAAVLFRLALHGFNAFTSAFDGDSTDWLVEIPETGKLAKLEVRWAKRSKHGRPTISLRKSNGRHATRRFRGGEVDFLVGYDLRTDTAYVFSDKELRNVKSMISVREGASERWDKLRG